MVAQEVTPGPQRDPVWDTQVAPPRHPTVGDCVSTTFNYLHNSGWYWGAISANEAQEALLTTAEGTFLVRDSSHPQYMLTLSVRTCCGPTSVHIMYNKGTFWLDSISAAHCRSFPSVPSLIQHYTDEKDVQGKTHTKIQAGQFEQPTDGSSVLLKLRRPLHRPKTFPCLQHLTRLTINRHTNCLDLLPLPTPLCLYLQDYPFHI